MINREDFNGKTYDEMLAVMQADLVTYAETVAAFTTADECNVEEQVLMASMDEVQARLTTVEYEIPKDVYYENKRYSKKDISAKIVYFLNKIGCKWEQTLGIHQLISLWKSDMNSIGYHAYDSTLRCLNTVTFMGDDELVGILATNEYLSQCHNEYSLDTGMLLYLSECHNIVMNRMKELDPAANVPEQMN